MNKNALLIFGLALIAIAGILAFSVAKPSGQSTDDKLESILQTQPVKK